MRPRSRQLPYGASAIAVTGMLVLRSLAIPLAACLGVTACAALAGQQTVSIVAWTLAWILASLVLHECGHVAAYRVVAGHRAACTVKVRRLRAIVVRYPLSPWKDIVVTVAGPLAPALVTLPAATAVSTSSPMYGVAMILAATSHVFLLLDPRGDGAALASAIRDLLKPQTRT